MKYKFEIKKENRSIIWKILLIMIYFSFYAISIRLFMTYFPFINKELIIVVGVFIYLFIILPMVFTPKWYLSNNSILIVQPSSLIETWEYFILKKGIQEIKYSDFINKISDELELKVQISSSFEKETIYDVIILENLAIISHLNEIQKNAIIIYVLDKNSNVFDYQNIYINYYIRDLLLYEDLHQAILKSKDYLLKKANTISLKSGKINYHIIKNNILYIESYRNYIVIHTSISDYTLRYTLKKIQKKLGNEFIQCHKSYLVNLNNVICIKEKFIELKNKITLPIGNKYKQNLHNLICK